MATTASIDRLFFFLSFEKNALADEAIAARLDLKCCCLEDDDGNLLRERKEGR